MVTRETALREGLEQLGLQPADADVARLDAYAEMLLEEAIPRGYLAKGEGPRLLPRHILEGAASVPLLGPGAVVDVGSGAGIPGIVLACLRQEPTLLVDAEGRKVRFLERCVAGLDLGSASVLRGRAEALGREPAHRDAWPNVIARALAPPEVAVELCLPLCEPGGKVIILAGPTVAGAREDIRSTAGALNGRLEDVQRLDIPGAEASSWAVIVGKVGAGPPAYPRRPGVASRTSRSRRRGD